KHDHRGTMRFAALQSSYANVLLAGHPELRNADTFVLYEPGEKNGEQRFFTRSRAAVRIGSYLGGLWKLSAVFLIVPRPIRDWLYDTFARYRYRWFGKYDTCPIPPPEVRSRFLDQQPV
ncbi:MAG TPA: DCC1-like thiol-disulfide oxidoreductase family protein, partial [Acidobacteriota bacterium]|nr:DCC1-like thiol-disulfide oxidoreductase family protein [Acidobacteriota bacterium]